MLLLLFSRLLSPQFLVWPVPFVAVAWAYGDRLSGRVFALASGITLAYVFRYDQFIGGSTGLAFLVCLRNALLLFVGVRLLVNGLRPAPALEGEAAHAAQHEPELIAG